MAPPSEIAKSILSELVYFDVFEHPLTAMELWRYCSVAGAQLTNILDELGHNDWLRARVDQRWGMYFLRGRDHVVELRMIRYRESEAKYLKALRFANRLAAFPFIRMIAVCNSLAYSNSRSDGDIDLFFITAPGRIWTARWHVTGYLKVLGERPTRQVTRDKICASFFIAPEAFDLRTMKISQSDIYLAHWVKQIVPIYDSADWYQKFMAANAWAEEYFPHGYPIQPALTRRVASSRPRLAMQKTFETVYRGAVGDAFEKMYERIQRRLLPDELRRLAGQDTRVVMTPTMLKFHENDRRAMYQERWLERCKELGV
ncbi:MAG: hypothetical protein WC497_06095 [Patescibacteria group bacterium]